MTKVSASYIKSQKKKVFITLLRIFYLTFKIFLAESLNITYLINKD